MGQVIVNNDIKSVYDNQYSEESSEWRSLGARFKAINIMEITAGLKFNKVLEVGAGEGSILKFLDDNKFADELYALEISESGVEQIKNKRISSLKSIQLFDGYKIPFEDNAFDLVYISHVLEHVEFERSLLREIKRVSKFQVIEVPKDYRRGVDKNVKHFLSYGHINVYTPSSLKYLLKTEGFQILKEKLGVYDRKIYQYMAGKSLKKKVLYHLAWNFKNLMVISPIASLKEKYCNTVTVLAKADNQGIKIF